MVVAPSLVWLPSPYHTEGEGANILATISPALEEYLAAHPEIKLHRDSHNLNSSQAMCFDLFFPFTSDAPCARVVVASADLPRRPGP